MVFLGSFGLNTFDAQCCPEYETTTTTTNNMSATLAYAEDMRRWTEPQRRGNKRQPNHTPPATRERTLGAWRSLCQAPALSVSGLGAVPRAISVPLIQSANSLPTIRPADLRFRPQFRSACHPFGPRAPSSDALCIGPQRSSPRHRNRRSPTQRALRAGAPGCVWPGALWVGARALCVGARRSCWDLCRTRRSLCRGALCVRARHFLSGSASGPGSPLLKLSVSGQRSLCRGPALSSCGLCVGPTPSGPLQSLSRGPALLLSGPGECYVGPRHSLCVGAQ